MDLIADLAFVAALLAALFAAPLLAAAALAPVPVRGGLALAALAAAALTAALILGDAGAYGLRTAADTVLSTLARLARLV